MAVAPQLPYDAARAVRRLRRADSELGTLMDRVGPLRLKRRPSRSTFVALAHAIVHQQLSTKAAGAIWGKLVEQVGHRGQLRPIHVRRAAPEALRSAGLSRAKAAAVADLAERAGRRQLPTITTLDAMADEAIVEALSEVRGVGRWTAEMILLFQLGRPDVLPLGDYGLRRGFGLAFGHDEVPSPEQVAARGERWRPFRSVASWYLWRALEL